jgi:tetratricopeptide (TPR) repeat protein
VPSSEHSATLLAVAEEWFRSGDWSEEAQADFEQRLRRARTYNRAQYLRIKGLALEAAGETAGARELWNRVLLDDGEFAELQGYPTLEHLGDSYAGEDPASAEQYYRRLLSENPSLKGTTATQHIKLAELLLRRGRPEDLDEAEALLTDWVDAAQSPFPNAHFRWNLAVIRLAEARRDRQAAREAARRALNLADRGPVFPRHQTVGVVETDRATLKRLQKLAK